MDEKNKVITIDERTLVETIKKTVDRVLKEEFDDMGLQRHAMRNALMNSQPEMPDTCDPEGTMGVKHSFDFVVPGDEFYHKMEIKSTKDFNWKELDGVVKALFGSDARLAGGMANSSFYFNGYDLDKEGRYIPDGQPRGASVRGRWVKDITNER